MRYEITIHYEGSIYLRDIKGDNVKIDKTIGKDRKSRNDLSRYLFRHCSRTTSPKIPILSKVISRSLLPFSFSEVVNRAEGIFIRV